MAFFASSYKYTTAHNSIPGRSTVHRRRWVQHSCLLSNSDKRWNSAIISFSNFLLCLLLWSRSRSRVLEAFATLGLSSHLALTVIIGMPQPKQPLLCFHDSVFLTTSTLQIGAVWNICQQHIDNPAWSRSSAIQLIPTISMQKMTFHWTRNYLHAGWHAYTTCSN